MPGTNMDRKMKDIYKSEQREGNKQGIGAYSEERTLLIKQNHVSTDMTVAKSNVNKMHDVTNKQLAHRSPASTEKGGALEKPDIC
jgi:hypothetical protein